MALVLPDGAWTARARGASRGVGGVPLLEVEFRKGDAGQGLRGWVPGSVLHEVAERELIQVLDELRRGADEASGETTTERFSSANFPMGRG